MSIETKQKPEMGVIDNARNVEQHRYIWRYSILTMIEKTKLEGRCLNKVWLCDNLITHDGGSMGAWHVSMKLNPLASKRVGIETPLETHAIHHLYISLKSA